MVPEVTDHTYRIGTESPQAPVRNLAGLDSRHAVEVDSGRDGVSAAFPSIELTTARVGPNPMGGGQGR